MNTEVIFDIKPLIYTIREQQVMFDRDLAILYQIETGRLNESVKRNIRRFPEDFMFQLTKSEFENWKVISEESRANLISQIAISSLPLKSISSNVSLNWGGIRKLPYVFTENGIAMLSGILHSPVAIEMNIRIMRTFVAIRKAVANGSLVVNPTASRMEHVESGLLAVQSHIALHDKQFDEVFKRLEEKEAAPTQGIYYDGQIFDAYKFVCDKVQEAQREVVLIDNYIDTSVLSILDKRSPGVAATIYTQNKFASVQQDVAKHNAQYPAIILKRTGNVHDRFLIIDDTVYHIGASIKDLGKKLFAFSKLTDITPAEILSKLK